MNATPHRRSWARPLAAVARASAIVAATMGSLAGGMAAAAILPGHGGVAPGPDAGTTLTGRVLGTLYPGAIRPIELIAENESPAVRRIGIVRLQRVTPDSDHRSCDTSDVSMQNLAEDIRVPAWTAGDVLPQRGSLVYQDDGGDQDACAGALLTLAFSSS